MLQMQYLNIVNVRRSRKATFELKEKLYLNLNKNTFSFAIKNVKQAIKVNLKYVSCSDFDINTNLPIFSILTH